jgi:sugar (pentulose or hexulose) kinase
MKTPTIAIFDIGKTNKKLFLFNENYEIVYEKSTQFDEILDEDGDACENLELLNCWIVDTFQEVQNYQNFEIKAVNFSAYGASFVHIGYDNKPVTPLYNYLKSYPEYLKKQFYDTYGGEEHFAVQTASPVLGHLNSGMQLYWLKYEKPAIFAQIKTSLHLPQYISFLLSGQCYSDITSIGCHTNLWDFQKNEYHEWVSPLAPEGGDNSIYLKLAPIHNNLIAINSEMAVTQFPLWGLGGFGIGLHDSSAALIPYLASFSSPFVLISTGTWCVSMNPFNDSPLTFEELQQDCLCYLTYQGNPVKSSRLFAGYEHEQAIKQLAEQFGVSEDYYKKVKFDKSLIENSTDNTYETAYHQLMLGIVKKQVIATQLVLNNSEVNKIFVDGGFSKNPIYMTLLAKSFPEKEIYAASVAQASALGAALAIHEHWNTKPLPDMLIELQGY